MAAPTHRFLDLALPEHAFFGVFDGHDNGQWVATELQRSLHFEFMSQLAGHICHYSGTVSTDVSMSAVKYGEILRKAMLRCFAAVDRCSTNSVLTQY